MTETPIRLTLGQAQHMIDDILLKQGLGGMPSDRITISSDDLKKALYQLLDTMRENERLRHLIEQAHGALWESDSRAGYFLKEALSNKHSEEKKNG